VLRPADARCNEGRNQVAADLDALDGPDLSGVEQFQATPLDLTRLADLDVSIARLVPNLAIVVIASQPLVFGMARMWEALAHQTGWRIRIVQTRDEAIDWLRSQVPDITLS
jgi:hypothetical protein